MTLLLDVQSLAWGLPWQQRSTILPCWHRTITNRAATRLQPLHWFSSSLAVLTSVFSDE